MENEKIKEFYIVAVGTGKTLGFGKFETHLQPHSDDLICDGSRWSGSSIPRAPTSSQNECIVRV